MRAVRACKRLHKRAVDVNGTRRPRRGAFGRHHQLATTPAPEGERDIDAYQVLVSGCGRNRSEDHSRPPCAGRRPGGGVGRAPARGWGDQRNRRQPHAKAIFQTPHLVYPFPLFPFQLSIRVLEVNGGWFGTRVHLHGSRVEGLRVL
jgi:hypothetical protein